MVGKGSHSAGWIWPLLGIGAFTATFWVQCRWFEGNYRQPLIYDAAEYAALAGRLEFDGPIPKLDNGGFRTYGYPLLLRPFVERLSVKSALRWSYRLQFVMLGGLLLALRWLLLPRGPAADFCLIATTLALPVLLPYCVVLLSDLSALVFLQFALLALAGAFGSANTGTTAWRLFLAGALLGFAIQIRPAYYHLTWPALLDVAWSGGRLGYGSPAKLSRRLARASFLVVALGLGYLLASAPTIRAELQSGRPPRVIPDQSSLLCYHLMLGLSMDRWSSNPPPMEQLHLVGQQWQERGWSLSNRSAETSPSFRDFRREVIAHPLTAARQWLKHVYYAFEKWELFPYQGTPSPWWQREIWWANWLVLGAYCFEAIRRLRNPTSRFDRRFAAWQWILLIYLILTVGLIVPEERYTLAVYPVALVYTAAVIHRMAVNSASHAITIGAK